MEYKGKYIGEIPTFDIVASYIKERGLPCRAKDVFAYWNRKKWLTNEGRYPKTLESAVSTYNRLYVSRQKKQAKAKPKDNGKTRPALGNEWETYDKQLNDPRWKSFRRFIFVARGRRCEMCGSTKVLQIHHPRYIHGRRAWEYTCNEVVVLCNECHKAVHGIKKKHE